jgi:DivIVA domain-containing protein
LFLLVLTLLVVAAVAAVAAGALTGGLDDPTGSVPARALPEGAVAGADIDALRFSAAVRGYRMDQVDAALDRLRDEITVRDEELARLRVAVGRPPGDPRLAAPPTPPQPWTVPGFGRADGGAHEPPPGA